MLSRLLLLMGCTCCLSLGAVPHLAMAESDSEHSAEMANEQGLIHVESQYSVPVTADRLVTLLKSKGMTVFTRIDHAAGAQSVGKSLPPTEVVVFGNPKVGTPLMQCSPTAAIDLPQKALIREDKTGKVWLSYNNPQYLAQRHQVEGCDAVLIKIEQALAKFAQAATQ
ncbi:DUF302 domain-containing protein [Acaryochloris sp. CCMEE 5410]|uniref:DUF302 domain-containing protein n=1 Tax=Acaryochloris sp. CCMEE 5410 TaxID=310037 RepID=UPI0002483E85|nr:DUF302 domain-containing protein [Acaryochloris sp. CCMEE 5410]KAI9133418.1 DUF302 domain-containing protein [Acaryochloris sp. CCMEE 5410]